MNDWVRIGNRYLNLGNVCEVLVDEHTRVVRVQFVGNGVVDLRDEDARDLQQLLARESRSIEEPHRSVFPLHTPS
jgi:repressor of nif and glnA expression